MTESMDFPKGLYPVIDAPDRTVCQHRGIVSVVSEIDDLREELRVANARVAALEAQLSAAQASLCTVAWSAESLDRYHRRRQGLTDVALGLTPPPKWRSPDRPHKRRSA